jgi:hypothetical protein
VGRVLGLALAAQHIGDLRGETPERLSVGVDYEPVALAVGWLGYEGLHGVKKAARTQRAARRRMISEIA